MLSVFKGSNIFHITKHQMTTAIKKVALTLAIVSFRRRMIGIWSLELILGVIDRFRKPKQSSKNLNIITYFSVSFFCVSYLMTYSILL